MKASRRFFSRGGSRPLVVGIRREDANNWERRVPLTPKHVKTLTSEGAKVLIQPSSIRCYTDSEYEEAGALVQEDLSGAKLILAVKDVPIDLLEENKTYMFFSHTQKGQEANMPLLDAVLRKNIRLIDYEKVEDENSRLVRFGPYAGFAGMVDVLHALGLALLARGISTPFLQVSLAKTYPTVEAARKALLAIGDLIRSKGLPKEICPLTFTIVGAGSVSMATQQMLHCLPCHYVQPSELKRLFTQGTKDNRHVYVSVVTAKDYIASREGKGRFDKEDFYENPNKYVSVFNERIAPYSRVLVNAIYWDEKYPKLLTLPQIEMLYNNKTFPTVVLGDISCDPGGSIELLQRVTTLSEPIYGWDVPFAKEVPFHSMGPDCVAVIGVDALAAEFPAQSSDFFGDQLLPFVRQVHDDADLPVEEQNLPQELRRAVITCKGALAPSFKYIEEIRKKRIKVQSKQSVQTVLLFGCGRVAGSVVEYLLQNNPTCILRLADRNIAKCQQIFAKYVPPKDKDRVKMTSIQSGTSDASAAIEGSDVVISLLPFDTHTQLIPPCIQYGKHLFTASYEQEDQRPFDKPARDAGILILNELGSDPGLSHMTAHHIIKDVQSRGGIIESWKSWVGSVPYPTNSNNCLGYKFSWSPLGVLKAMTRPATFRYGGNVIEIPGELSLLSAVPIQGYKALRLVSIPNGNSLMSAQAFGLDERTRTIQRNTFRFAGFNLMGWAFTTLGFLSEVPSPGATFRDLIQARLTRGLAIAQQERLGFPEALEEYLISQWRFGVWELRNILKDNPGLQSYFDGYREGESVQANVRYMVNGLRELGLLDQSPIEDTPLLALCSVLTKKLRLEENETDFLLMRHHMKCYYPTSGQHTNYSLLLALSGEDNERTGTAKTVGLPVAIAATLSLRGEFPAMSGLLRATLHPEIYQPILAQVAKNGVKWLERERAVRCATETA